MKIICNWRAGLGYKLILNFKTHLFCLVLPHFWHVAYTIFEETIAHIFPLRSGSHFGENSLDWAGFSLYILNTALLCFIHKGFKWFHFFFIVVTNVFWPYPWNLEAWWARRRWELSWVEFVMDAHCCWNTHNNTSIVLINVSSHPYECTIIHFLLQKDGWTNTFSHFQVETWHKVLYFNSLQWVLTMVWMLIGQYCACLSETTSLKSLVSWLCRRTAA